MTSNAKVFDALVLKELRMEDVLPVPRGKQFVIPTDRNKKRQKGNPKPMVAFRCPSDLLAYFSRALESNDDRTELIVMMLRIARDCSAKMGDDWWEIDRRANVEKRPVGEVLGELALAALVASRKPKK